jgi:ParB family chromosome partitioning protein
MTKRTAEPQLATLPAGSGRDIPLADITVPRDRMRGLRPEKVDEVAESIRTGLQIQPIVVRPRKGGGYELIVGWHRLEASKTLNHETIRAEIVVVDNDQAKLIEIDENLIRAELSPAETAIHWKRRKELYEKAHPETKHGGAPGKAGGGKKRSQSRQNGDFRFTKDAAKKTGKSERTVQREIARAARIDNLADVVGTSLDEADELDALANLPPARQNELIARAKAGAQGQRQGGGQEATARRTGA